MRRYKHQDITKEIISAFYKVYNTLGYGFLEKVYENALSLELKKRGFKLEIKSAETIIEAHEAQLLNYLRATNIEVGLVLNFGPKPQISRKVYETARHRKPFKKP